MKKILLFLASFIFGIVVFVLVIKEVGFRNIKEALSLFSSLDGLAIFIITCLISLVGILKWRFVLKSQGYNFSFIALGKIWFSTFTISYLTPISLLGGEPYMIYSLKKHFPISWDKNIASVITDKLLDLSIFLLFMILGILSFFFLAGLPPRNLCVVISGIVIILLVFLITFYFKVFRKESILKWFLKPIKVEGKSNGLIFDIEKEIFHFFNPRKKWLWKGLCLSFLKYFLVLIRCLLIVYFLGGGMGIFRSSAVLAFVNLASLFPIPASFGSLEAGQAFAFSLLGLGSNMGTAFSMILRGADLLVCLAGAVFLVEFGIKTVTDKVINKVTFVFRKK